MKRKPLTHYIERFGAYPLALVLSSLVIRYSNPQIVLCNSTIFDKAIDVGGILFGFLLTVLTLLIQTNNPTIQQLKKGKRFKDLIFYNKESVICSVLLFSYSFVLLIYAEYTVLYSTYYVDKVTYGLFIFLVFITVLKAYQFTKIFYSIIS